MPQTDNPAIAARIRELILSHGGGSVETVADQLGVSEVALRISIDELQPFPTLGVIQAIVQVYGVDPMWLLTGGYNADLHRRTLEADSATLGEILGRLVGPPTGDERPLH